jgi:hypothetical protein
LDRAAQVGADVSEAVGQLEALVEEGGSSLLGSSPSLAEIEAVTHRLTRLADRPAPDDWLLHETVEQAAEVLRVLRRGALRARLTSEPQAAFDFINTTLTGIPDDDIGRLVGAAPEELDQWRERGLPSNQAERISTVALALLELPGSMTPAYVLQWFSDKRAQLDGQSPLQQLDSGDPTTRDRLRRLARASHAALAA